MELADLNLLLSMLQLVMMLALGYFLNQFFVNPFGRAQFSNMMGKNSGIALMLNKSRKIRFKVIDLNKPTFEDAGLAYNVQDGQKYFLQNLTILIFQQGNSLPLDLDEKAVRELVCECGIKHNIAVLRVEKAPSEYLSAIIVKLDALMQSKFFRTNQALLWTGVILGGITLLGLAYWIFWGSPNAEARIIEQTAVSCVNYCSTVINATIETGRLTVN